MRFARQGMPQAGNTAPATARCGARGFDFTSQMHAVCHDMVTRVDALRHIDMDRVAVSFSQTRRATAHGMYASLTPMRFAGGRRHAIRRGQKWAVQQLYRADGREVLYILNFYLPRFLNLGFREKLCTVIHELWHIGPSFDGDLRRFKGRCFAHGSSQKRYDAHVEQLIDLWLHSEPPASACDSLTLDFRHLIARHARVYGRRIPNPKLIPVADD